MDVPLFDDDQDAAPISAINTTPLVDVMLVLLIIFLITVPVVIHTVPVSLPRESVQPARIRPGTIAVTVDGAGRLFWNQEPVADAAHLGERLKAAAAQDPQPEITLRGDRAVAYDAVGAVVEACRQAGIVKLRFITEPPARGQ